MKVSELVEKLDTFVEKHGDMEVVASIIDFKRANIVADNIRNVEIKSIEDIKYCELS